MMGLDDKSDQDLNNITDHVNEVFQDVAELLNTQPEVGAIPDRCIDAELVAFFYRVPVRHMPGEWIANVAKVGDS